MNYKRHIEKIDKVDLTIELNYYLLRAALRQALIKARETPNPTTLADLEEIIFVARLDRDSYTWDLAKDARDGGLDIHSAVNELVYKLTGFKAE